MSLVIQQNVKIYVVIKPASSLDTLRPLGHHLRPREQDRPADDEGTWQKPFGICTPTTRGERRLMGRFLRGGYTGISWNNAYFGVLR